MMEHLRHFIRVFNYLIERYTAVVFGWMGIIAWLLASLSIIDVQTALMFAGMGSGMATFLGHHALAMGWYDDE